jgi:hypothetical protein
MDRNGTPPEHPDVSNYEEGRNTIPREVELRFAGKYVAVSPDGTSILASGDSLEEVDRNLEAAGIHFSQVVHDYIDPPDHAIVSLL